MAELIVLQLLLDLKEVADGDVYVEKLRGKERVSELRKLSLAEGYFALRAYKTFHESDLQAAAADAVPAFDKSEMAQIIKGLGKVDREELWKRRKKA